MPKIPSPRQGECNWERRDSYYFGVYWCRGERSGVIVREWPKWSARSSREIRMFWRLSSAQKWLDNLETVNAD